MKKTETRQAKIWPKTLLMLGELQQRRLRNSSTFKKPTYPQLLDEAVTLLCSSPPPKTRKRPADETSSVSIANALALLVTAISERLPPLEKSGLRSFVIDETWNEQRNETERSSSLSEPIDSSSSRDERLLSRAQQIDAEDKRAGRHFKQALQPNSNPEGRGNPATRAKAPRAASA